MRLPSVPTLPMVDHLNIAYFNTVWNASDDHGRANFPLQKAARRVQTGVVAINLSVVGLPTTDKVYAVYHVSPHVFGRFVSLPQNSWINDASILADNGVAISGYAVSGRLIPLGKTWFRYDTLRNMVLIAIDKTYTSKCIGELYPNLYMTIDFDTSRQTPIVNHQWVVTNAVTGDGSPNVVRQAILDTNALHPASTKIFINGWFYDVGHLPVLAKGDIVELIADPDIVGYCDLNVDDTQTGYYSELYGEYREILHIPKILNNTNVVITNDTLDIVIYDKVSKKGVYGHRIDPHALESITHNDFSISRTVLQAFQNSLSASGVIVRLYVRLPTRQIKLNREVNQIIDLYSLPDAEIKLQLTGMSAKQIVEWRAVHLEQSSYLTLLYDFKGFTSNDLLSRYSAAMGYYDVASVLSESIHSYTYHKGEVQINKPTRLIGYPVEVIVYVDGRKLPRTTIALSDYCSRTFILGFKTTAHVADGSRVTVYITEGGVRQPTSFHPVSGADTITLGSDDYVLVEALTYTQPQQVWNGTVTKGYHFKERINANYQISFNTNGTVTYKVPSTQWGKHFYLVPICALDTTSYPLDDLLFNHEPIILPLNRVDDTEAIIPLIGTRAIEIYINGYRLIEGLDYTLDSIVNHDNDVLQVLLAVSSTEYINFEGVGNMLDVVIHGDIPTTADRGYVIDNKLHRTAPPMIWNKACGRVFAKGKLIEKIIENGNTLISADDLDQGIPYLAEWSMPYSVTKLMTGISPVSDSNLRTRITGVLGLIPPTYPSTVILDDLYSLYSPYLAKIVTDVANGALTIIDDPQDNRFLNQFTAYKLLYPRDPVLNKTNRFIDRRFVTLAAHYVNLSVDDPQQMLLVQRLVALLLTPSELSIDEVLV